MGVPQYIRIDDPFTPLDVHTRPSLTLRPTMAHETYCVYKHEVDSPDGVRHVMFIGVIKLAEIFTFADARRNSEWVKYIGNADASVVLTIIGTGGYVACMNERARIATATKAHCNMYGHDVSSNMRIRCRETDEIFMTIVAAAKHFDCSQSALSNHLNAKPGFKSVKGRTFERIP